MRIAERVFHRLRPTDILRVARLTTRQLAPEASDTKNDQDQRNYNRKANTDNVGSAVTGRPN